MEVKEKGLVLQLPMAEETFFYRMPFHKVSRPISMSEQTTNANTNDFKCDGAFSCTGHLDKPSMPVINSLQSSCARMSYITQF